MKSAFSTILFSFPCIAISIDAFDSTSTGAVGSQLKRISQKVPLFNTIHPGRRMYDSKEPSFSFEWLRRIFSVSPYIYIDK